MLPAENAFDVSRAMLEDHLDSDIYPPQLIISQYAPLSEALAAGKVAEADRLLTFMLGDQLFAFPMSLVLSYNVIQGQIGDRSWMMTFCNACNTGMVFNPMVGGELRHFQRRGSYDGLLLIWDEETASYWQHITGKCLHGDSVGQTLNWIAITRQMSVAEARTYVGATFLFADALTPQQQKLSRMIEMMRANPERTVKGIVESIGAEDPRRPRFELGLGLWESTRSLFYPLTVLHTLDNAVSTTFGAKSVLIYQHPEALSPVAVFLASTRHQWQGDVLKLDHGAYIKNDQYFRADGQVQPLERPNQLLMRWYGFAATFPNCELPILDPS